MADSSYTMTGLVEHLAAIERLPATTLSRSRLVAGATAQRVLAGARARLASPSPPVRFHGPRGTVAIADAIGLVEDTGKRQFTVISQSPSGTPSNTVIWFSYGTIKQPARPYLGPALDAERAQYQQDMEEVAAACLDELRAP